MTEIQKKVQEELNKPITGHPSNEDSQKIERLERLVIKLSYELDSANGRIDGLEYSINQTEK